jgi:ferritin-like metal-binding protein YciE
MKTLRTLFLNELADIYDAEQRIVKALPKLAKVVTCEELRGALNSHLAETEGHIAKVEEVFGLFGEKANGKKCAATVGLLKEGDEIASDHQDEPTVNAAVISAVQKVEHYEIASYGCLHEWAKLLGNQQAADLIEEILEEEKDADETLTELAEAKNQEALAAEETVSSHR